MLDNKTQMTSIIRHSKEPWRSLWPSRKPIEFHVSSGVDSFQKESEMSFTATSFVFLPLLLPLNPEPLPPTADEHCHPSRVLLLARGFLNREHLIYSPPTHVSLSASLGDLVPPFFFFPHCPLQSSCNTFVYGRPMFKHIPIAGPHVCNQKTAALQSLATAVFHCLTGSWLLFEAALKYFYSYLVQSLFVVQPPSFIPLMFWVSSRSA